MMGPSHSATGLLAGLASLPYAPVTGVASQVAWVAAWSGFALLPDMDTRMSTAARLWGPLTSVPAGAVGTLARGHRAGTHDALVAPVVAAALAAVALLHPWVAGVFLALTVGLALVALDPILPGDQGKAVGNLVVSAAAAWWLVTAGVSVGWLPLAAAGGVLVHILGDALTTNGVPVPLSTWVGRPRSWGPRLFRTGYDVDGRLGVERFVYAGVWCAVAWAVWVVVSPGQWSVPDVSSVDVEGLARQAREVLSGVWQPVPSANLTP